MPRVFCKLLQKIAYDLLLYKHATLYCFVGFVFIFCSILQFGQHLIKWNHIHYSVGFNSFQDNIAHSSFQDSLCQYFPIDVVYTWVNGSDPAVLKELKAEKRKLELEHFKQLKSDCAADPNCIVSDFILVHRNLTHELSHFSRRHASLRVKITDLKNSSFLLLQLYNVGVTDGIILLNDAIKNSSHFFQEALFSSHSNFTDSTIATNFLISFDVPSYSPRYNVYHNLPYSLRQLISEVHLYREKNAVVFNVSDVEKVQFIIESFSNSTILNHGITFHRVHIPVPFSQDESEISPNRFADNEELRFSLRSIQKFAPWVHHVYIVTNGQIPRWLNLNNPQVTLVTHQEIFRNKSHLPTFSSPAIETHLHRIPGLSKKFLYLNDDVMFGKEVLPDDFFSKRSGFQVYLTWPVPSCVEGCPSPWIRDGYCDAACNNPLCLWDGGDCTELFTTVPNQHKLHLSVSEIFCSPGCAHSWLADMFCDQKCNVRECGFDAGDCGVQSFNQMLGQRLSPFIRKYHFPLVNASYFNLTLFLTKVCIGNYSGEIINALYSEMNEVRLLAVNLKFQVLTIIAKDVRKPFTVLAKLVYKCQNESNSFTFNVTFNNRKYHKARAKVEESSTVTGKAFSLKPDITMKNIPFTFRPVPADERGPKAHEINAENYMKFDDNHVKTPRMKHSNKSLISALEKLHVQFKSGDLTEKGYRLKKAAIISRLSRNSKIRNKPSRSIHEIPTFPSAVAELEGINARNPLSYPSMLKMIKSVRTSFMPWEKSRSTSSAHSKATNVSPPTHYTTIPRRVLLDTYADSLRYVNNLFHTKFGIKNRLVPGHIAHLVDKDIILGLQRTFADEFEKTSSHKFRLSTDMQFSFSYFHFLMLENGTVSLDEIFNKFDFDESGTLSDREIRFLIAQVYGTPVSDSMLQKFEHVVQNCSMYSSNIKFLSKKFERFYNLSIPVVTKELVSNCPSILSALNDKFGNNLKNKFVIRGEEDITFKMIGTNLSILSSQLDSIRNKPTKFICLNDNIDHLNENATKARALLSDFYETLFPEPSSFELPGAEKNEFSNVSEFSEHTFNKRMVWLRNILFVVFMAASAVYIVSRVLLMRRRSMRYRNSRLWNV